MTLNGASRATPQWSYDEKGRTLSVDLPATACSDKVLLTVKYSGNTTGLTSCAVAEPLSVTYDKNSSMLMADLGENRRNVNLTVFNLAGSECMNKSYTGVSGFNESLEHAAAESASGARITGGGDLKWTISRNGFYRLELDTRTEILTGTLLEAEPEQAPAGTRESAGVAEVPGEPAGQCVYYDLQGRRVANPGCGVYVEVCGSAAGKVMHR